MSVVVVIGVAAGGLGIALVWAAVFFFCRARRQQQEDTQATGRAAAEKKRHQTLRAKDYVAPKTAAAKAEERALERTSSNAQSEVAAALLFKTAKARPGRRGSRRCSWSDEPPLTSGTTEHSDGLTTPTHGETRRATDGGRGRVVQSPVSRTASVASLTRGTAHHHQSTLPSLLPPPAIGRGRSSIVHGASLNDNLHYGAELRARGAPGSPPGALAPPGAADTPTAETAIPIPDTASAASRGGGLSSALARIASSVTRRFTANPSLSPVPVAERAAAPRRRAGSTTSTMTAQSVDGTVEVGSLGEEGGPTFRRARRGTAAALVIDDKGNADAQELVPAPSPEGEPRGEPAAVFQSRVRSFSETRSDDSDDDSHSRPKGALPIAAAQDEPLIGGLALSNRGDDQPHETAGNENESGHGHSSATRHGMIQTTSQPVASALAAATETSRPCCPRPKLQHHDVVEAAARDARVLTIARAERQDLLTAWPNVGNLFSKAPIGIEAPKPFSRMAQRGAADRSHNPPGTALEELALQRKTVEPKSKKLRMTDVNEATRPAPCRDLIADKHCAIALSTDGDTSREHLTPGAADPPLPPCSGQHVSSGTNLSINSQTASENKKDGVPGVKSSTAVVRGNDDDALQSSSAVPLTAAALRRHNRLNQFAAVTARYWAADNDKHGGDGHRGVLVNGELHLRGPEPPHFNGGLQHNNPTGNGEEVMQSRQMNEACLAPSAGQFASLPWPAQLPGLSLTSPDRAPSAADPPPPPQPLFLPQPVLLSAMVLEEEAAAARCMAPVLSMCSFGSPSSSSSESSPLFPGEQDDRKRGEAEVAVLSATVPPVPFAMADDRDVLWPDLTGDDGGRGCGSGRLLEDWVGKNDGCVDTPDLESGDAFPGLHVQDAWAPEVTPVETAIAAAHERVERDQVFVRCQRFVDAQATEVCVGEIHGLLAIDSPTPVVSLEVGSTDGRRQRRGKASSNSDAGTTSTGSEPDETTLTLSIHGGSLHSTGM